MQWCPLNNETNVRWVTSAPETGVRMGRRGTDILIQWQGIGNLVCTADVEPIFLPCADANPLRLEKFRATSLMACRRYLQGKLSLHGAAVGFSSGVVILIGDGGSGKSTTAATLVQHGDSSFFADDVVPVDWRGADPFVVPVNDAFWLLPDAREWLGEQTAASGKGALRPRARSTEPERLCAIVHLQFEDSLDSPQVERLTGSEAFVALSRAHICYSVDGQEDAVKNLAVRARLASAAPVLRLRRPRSLDALASVAQILRRLG